MTSALGGMNKHQSTTRDVLSKLRSLDVAGLAYRVQEMYGVLASSVSGMWSGCRGVYGICSDDHLVSFLCSVLDQVKTDLARLKDLLRKNQSHFEQEDVFALNKTAPTVGDCKEALRSLVKAHADAVEMEVKVSEVVGGFSGLTGHGGWSWTGVDFYVCVVDATSDVLSRVKDRIRSVEALLKKP